MQFAIQTSSPISLAGAKYLLPETHVVGTTGDLAKAASFSSVESARGFFNMVAPKLSVKKAQIVSVEKVRNQKVDFYSIAVNAAVPSSVKFVLTRSPAISRSRFVHSLLVSGPTYTDDLNDAKMFSSLSDAIAGIKVKGGVNDISGIATVRQVDEWSFKVTFVEAVTVGNFVRFEVPDSSVISAIEYDQEAGVLRLTLKRSARAFSLNSERMQPESVYQYNNVDAADVFAFLAAKSKGSHYSRVFKAKYDKGAVKV